MADQITTKFLIVDVEKKTGERGDGKGKWTVFNLSTKTPEGMSGPPISTFSTTAGQVCEENKGKTLTVVIEQDTDKEGKPKTYGGSAVYKVMKILGEDGTTVLYEPGMDKRGGGGGGYNGGGQRPEWSYETAEERQQTRRSIEAQKALDLAVQSVSLVVQYGSGNAPTGDAIIELVRKTMKEFAQDIGELSGVAGEGSGSGSRSKGSPPPRADHDQGPTASTSGAEPARSTEPSRSESDPSPDSDLSPAAQKARIIAQLDELLGGRDALIERAVEKFGKKSLTLPELEVILAETTAAAMSSS